jgi:hypothetical protein
MPAVEPVTSAIFFANFRSMGYGPLVECSRHGA